MMQWAVTVGCLWAMIGMVNAANILFLNTARIGQSHLFFMGKLADVLAEAGHNVTFYQQDVYSAVKHTGTYKARAIRRPLDFEVYPPVQTHLWSEGGLFQNVRVLGRLGKTMKNACEAQIKDEAYIEELRRGHYDLAIYEWIDNCAIGIIRKLGIQKHIAASAVMQTKILMGIYGLPSAYEEYMDPDPTYYQRFYSIFHTYYEQFFRRYDYLDDLNHILRTDLNEPNFDVATEMAKSAYVFMNVDEHLNVQTPMTSKFVFLGGKFGHKERMTKLNEDFQQILNNGQKTVVVSFGTVARSADMPNHMTAAFEKTFNAFPEINFIWKYEEVDAVAMNFSNVYKRSWIPQNGLLAHPNVIGFVTHGGLNSVSEAAYDGVPTVCIPGFTDQMTNCRATELHGISVSLNKMTITAERLTSALDKILHDEGVRERAHQMSQMIRNKPFPSDQRIISYVDHALKYDLGEVFDLPERKVSRIKSYNLDYLLAGYTLLTVVLWLARWTTRRLAELMCKKVKCLDIPKNKLE